MDMRKIQARAELERMVYNYALLGVIDNGAANGIVSYIEIMIGCEEPPRRENNIIYFPAPAPAEHPAPEADPMPPYSEYCDTLRKYGFDNFKYLHQRMFDTLYDLRIRSLEELAKTPPEKIRQRGIGQKTYEIIRSVLESNGIASEAWGIPKAAVTRQEH